MIIEIKKLPFIKITEVAKMMGISESYTYTLAKMPSCPFVCKKIGKRVVVHTKSFVDWYLKVSDVDEEDVDKYLVDDKLFFTAVEIAKLLKVSKTVAYEFLNDENCPFDCIMIGKRKIVSVAAFYKWYMEYDTKVS